MVNMVDPVKLRGALEAATSSSNTADAPPLTTTDEAANAAAAGPFPGLVVPTSIDGDGGVDDSAVVAAASSAVSISVPVVPPPAPPGTPTSTDGGGGGIGPAEPQAGVKEPPVCLDSSLRESATSPDELEAMRFVDIDAADLVVPPLRAQRVPAEGSSSKNGGGDAGVLSSTARIPVARSSSGSGCRGVGGLLLPPDLPVPVSSSSSICTRESDVGGFSDAETNVTASGGRPKAQTMATRPIGSGCSPGAALAASLAATPIVASSSRQVSGHLNAKVSLRKTSRQGRSSQRWSSDPDSGEKLRLVTGCVPILSGGRIMFVSSSRKPEWILPKGGWEQDEAMEESALRETFEEAGVLGTLGPRLDTIQYETRKAKKRRLEMREMTAAAPEKRPRIGAHQTEDSNVAPKGMVDDGAEEVGLSVHDERGVQPNAQVISDEAMARIRGQAQRRPSTSSKRQQTDETASVASTTVSSQYSQVRMTLFTLYVSKVFRSWPECGRLRKAVYIDEAISMVEGRPEFKAALENVKRLGLHLSPPGGGSVQDQRHQSAP